MHDLVAADLESRWTARLSAGVIADLQARKQLGLERYGSLLQANNGRDALFDLSDELLDAAVYARQAQEERGDSQDTGFVYDLLLTLLIRVRRFRDEH
jgi:hypothetical protein